MLEATPNGTETPVISTAAPTTGTTMRGDANGQYIYNLGTKNLSAGDWKVIIDDPSFTHPVEATFGIKS